ncbi:MAG TPA: glycosyltransferase family 9 protein [Vicinamibacterales bacterium]|nr:glycosyltransferase family 9 protein [Vicinamibacterales bacterium]
MRIECRHFTGSAPCAPHKHDGRPCESCDVCEPVAERILIVKLGAAGDVLRTTCILPALRAQHPNAQITWITGRSSTPLLDHNPHIDRVVSRDEAIERLMVEQFDIVFGLDADESGAALASLARAADRAGFVLDARGRVVPANPAARRWWMMGIDDGLKRANRNTYPEILYEMCGLHGPVEAPQFVVSPKARTAIAGRLRESLAPFRVVIALNTGAGQRWAQKKWTAGHFAGFVRLVRRVHSDWAVMIAGGPDEVSANASLLTSTRDPGVFDGGCDHSLEAFGALLALGSVVVTADSLGLHMALALGVPAVALIGPTSPWELEMYGRGEVVHADVPCLACYRRRCPLPVTCMDLLDPYQVLEAVERQLTRPGIETRRSSAGGQHDPRSGLMTLRG